MLDENNNLNKENFSPKIEHSKESSKYENFKKTMPNIFGQQNSKN